MHLWNKSGIILCWFPSDADEVAVDSATLLVPVVCRAEHDAETSPPLGQHEGPLSVQTSAVHVVITPEGEKGKAMFRLIILGAFRQGTIIFFQSTQVPFSLKIFYLQGCALWKIEESMVVWACEIQRAQQRICMKKNYDYLVCQRPPGTGGADLISKYS